MSPSPQPSGPAPNRTLRWMAAGSALLMLAGVGAFAYASQVAARRAPGEEAVTVTLQGDACQPNELTVPAGRASFRIVNRTERAVEWEILDGVMVVEERENIAPGLSQTMTARLKPGEYAITCGLLSNPRGRLVVTPAATGAAPEAPSLVAFVGPLAEYQVFTQLQARALQREVAALDEAIRAGDLAEARKLYSQARAPYLAIAPVAGRIADLANAIDPVAAYLARREADEGFTGFHRLEYGLFGRNSLDGLAPVSARLLADVGTLRDRLRASKLAPADMTTGASRVLRTLADIMAGGGADLYSRTDLADFEASLSGIAKIVTLLKPVAAEATPAAFETVDTALSTLEGQVAGLRGADGYPNFDTVPADRRQVLSEGARALGQDLDQLGDALGITQGGA